MKPFFLGAMPIDKRTTAFRVWAPYAQGLSVRLFDLRRDVEMSRDEEGYFTAEAEAPAGSLYQYRFSDGRLRPDPASRSQPKGVHGPSRVVSPDFRWNDGPWKNPGLEAHVIYELHVGAFSPQGTFEAIIPRMGELRKLGVTAIELMPIGAFPGTRNWGYDGVFPFAAQDSYGGIEGLRRLVDAAHGTGMAVFLDVVYNHLGPEGNYLGEFGPYFTNRYRTPWGAAMNFDGMDSDAVREYFIQNALHWTRDNHIDGLRLDAVHAIVDHTARTFVEDLAGRVHEAGEAAGRRILVIAESSDNDPRIVRGVDRGGWALDGVWNDDYHHAIRTALTGDRRGYYAPFGAASQIEKALREGFVFTGEYCSFRRRRHGAPSGDVPRHRMVVFAQNHDQVGNRPAGDRLSETAGLAAARVFAGLTLLSPFTPLLFMGEEYAESAPFPYFVSHGDAELIEAVRKGRREEFADMHTGQEVPDPQDEATYMRGKLRWDLREEGKHAGMLAWHRRLLKLRSELSPGDETRVLPGEHNGVVAFMRMGKFPMIVVANLSENSVIFGLPVGAGKSIVLDSYDKAYGGESPAARLTSGQSPKIEMSAHHLVVLSIEECAHA